MYIYYTMCMCTYKILYLQNAFDEMIKILRFLNQSMDVVGLKGFPVR